MYITQNPPMVCCAGVELEFRLIARILEGTEPELFRNRPCQICCVDRSGRGARGKAGAGDFPEICSGVLIVDIACAFHFPVAAQLSTEGASGILPARIVRADQGQAAAGRTGVGLQGPGHRVGRVAGSDPIAIGKNMLPVALVAALDEANADDVAIGVEAVAGVGVGRGGGRNGVPGGQVEFGARPVDNRCS